MKRTLICGCLAIGLLSAARLSADEWRSHGNCCSDSSQVVTEYYVPAHESHRARSWRHPGYVSYGMSGTSSYSRCYDEDVREVSEFSFRGPIQSIRTLKPDRDGEQVVIVTIDDVDQGLTTINLGPQEQIASLNLRTSDRITVRGTDDRRDVNGRRIASKLEFNDRTIVLNNDIGTESFAVDDSRQLKGEIASTRTEMVGSTRHVILKLRGENDRIDVIDLGPERNLRDLNLREGQRITLRTRQGRFDGRTRLFASRLESNGRTVDIDREDQPRLQGQPVSPDDRDRDRDMDRDRDYRNENRMKEDRSKNDFDRSDLKDDANRQRSDTTQNRSDELKPEQSPSQSSGKSQGNSESQPTDK